MRRRSKLETSLAAYGSAGGWTIQVDEAASEPPKWFAQVEGPSVELYIEINSPEVAKEAYQFLARRSESSHEDLRLGNLGRTSVTLRRRAESPNQCTLIVGSTGETVITLSFFGKDLQKIAEALEQVMRDLRGSRL